MTNPTAEDLRERMAPELPEGLVAHIDRVVELAGDLAARHGLDVELARLMAQGHDLLRAVRGPELLHRAEQRGMAIDPVERDEPVLLHGPLGAIELRERFGVEDERVLDAIRWHTTGHPDYPPEAWAMFVADKVEPRKLAKRPKRLGPVRKAAERSLEAGALTYLDLVLRDAVKRGWQLHPMAVETRNALLRRGVRSG